MTELGKNYGEAHYTMLKGTALNITLSYTQSDGTAFSFTDYNIAGSLLDSRGNAVQALTYTKEGVDDVTVRAYLGATNVPERGIYRVAVIATNSNDSNDAFCIIFLKLTIA